MIGCGAISYTEAMSMDPGDRLALRVRMGEFRGGEFDWHMLRWHEDKGPKVM